MTIIEYKFVGAHARYVILTSRVRPIHMDTQTSASGNYIYSKIGYIHALLEKKKKLRFLLIHYTEVIDIDFGIIGFYQYYTFVFTTSKRCKNP